jgi:hypothetical protein
MPNGAKSFDGRLEQPAGANGNDVLRRDQAHGIQDKPVLFENQKVNIFPTDHLDSATDGRTGKHARALLNELYEQDAPRWLTRDARVIEKIKQPPQRGQGETQWYT